MSGYPGGGYPTQGGGYPQQQGGYPGSAPPAGGYPGAPPAQGGYPGAPPPQQAGGYPGAPPPGAPGAPPAGAPPPSYGGGGYPGQQPQVDPNVSQWFNAVDQDRSGTITAAELQKALVNGNWTNFSEEACRMMIEMFDRDRKGTINVQEFGALFQYINQWKATFESIDRDRSGYIEMAELQQDMYDKDASGTINLNEFQQLFTNFNQWKQVFESYDKNKSGSIEQNELNQAFTQMGYRFTPTFVQNVLSKYDPRTRRLTLDNFIVCCVQIKRLTDSFRTRDREMRGQATLQYEDFVGLALGAHK